MRDSSVTLLNPGPDTQWMYDRVFELVSRFNNQLWRFELSGAEPMQFAAYGVEQHYDWHMDLWANKPKNARKLSVSVQLNASEEYEGGSFEIDQSGAPNALGPRSKGAMILFPSYVLRCLVFVLTMSDGMAMDIQTERSKRKLRCLVESSVLRMHLMQCVHPVHTDKPLTGTKYWVR